MNKYQELLKNLREEFIAKITTGIWNTEKIENCLQELQEAVKKANKYDEIFEVYDFNTPICKDTAFNILNKLIDKNKELREKAKLYDEKETPIKPKKWFNNGFIHFTCSSCGACARHTNYCSNCGRKLDLGNEECQ